jgi:hypothetical protein
MRIPARWSRAAWLSHGRGCAGPSGAVQRPGPGSRGAVYLPLGHERVPYDQTSQGTARQGATHRRQGQTSAPVRHV